MMGIEPTISAAAMASTYAKAVTKAGTQHAAVKDDNDDSVTSINLETDGMPSGADLLKALGYQGMNIGSDSQSDDECDNIINEIGMLHQGLD